MRKYGLAACVVIALSAPQVFCLNQTQKDELYRHGTITIVNEKGEKTGHFSVNFMPGSDNIKQNSKKALDRAYHTIGNLVDSQGFWQRKVLGQAQHGVNYVKEWTIDSGIKVAEDFKGTREKNALIEGDFGARASQARNWLKFGGRSTLRALGAVWGVVAGSTYAVVAPLATIAWQPVSACAEGSIRGVVLPVLKYTWNGAAWVMAKDGNEPEKSSMTVEWIPAESSEQMDLVQTGEPSQSDEVEVSKD